MLHSLTGLENPIQKQAKETALFFTNDTQKAIWPRSISSSCEWQYGQHAIHTFGFLPYSAWPIIV